MQKSIHDMGHSEEAKSFSDQLLQLLSDNQLFITKIQKAQWNFNVLTLENYNSLINILFNCSELIADQLKLYNGHVPASFSVYLEMSQLKEELGIESEFEIKKDVIQSHNILLDSLMKFMNDEIDEFVKVRKLLTSELHQSHTEVYRHLEAFNKN